MPPPGSRTFSLTYAWPSCSPVPLPPAAVELLTALSKVLAGRGRSIRRTLRLLEEALDQSDLLPGFESIAQDGP